MTTTLNTNIVNTATISKNSYQSVLGNKNTYVIGTATSSNLSYSNIMDADSLTVNGKLIVNGLDVEERLKIIERVLGIPERDATIEAKYPSIKKKFDEYINSLEKYRTFERIKGSKND